MDCAQTTSPSTKCPSAKASRRLQLLSRGHPAWVGESFETAVAEGEDKKVTLVGEKVSKGARQGRLNGR